MLRRATTLLTRSPISLRARRFSTDVDATAPADSTFSDAWKKVVPHIDHQTTPLTFMKPRPATPSSIPTKLTVNFVLPYTSELLAKEIPRQKYEDDIALASSLCKQLGNLLPIGRSPNFWVFYIILDKVLAFVLGKLGFNIQAPATSFTGGLVWNSSPFAVLS